MKIKGVEYDEFDLLYFSYRALRRFDGWLRTDRISRDSEKVELYRHHLAKYRAENPDELLSAILRRMADRFTEDYSHQGRDRHGRVIDTRENG